MWPQVSRRPFTVAAAEMPSFQRQRRIPELRQRPLRIEQIRIVAILTSEVLSPELQSQVARELASAVAKAGRVDGVPAIARFVDDGAGNLGVMAPGPPIEVVGPD